MNIILGDCVEELHKLPPNHFDALLTDPPYGISFMSAKWDSFRDNKQYEEWTRKWGVEALRVLKPGAFGLIFGGTRTHHRTMCGLEDAGFKIRDVLMWLFVSSWPKGQDISKKIDEHFGIELKYGAPKISPDGIPKSKRVLVGHPKTQGIYGESVTKEEEWYEFEPTTEKAKQWYGYKTNLKPAYEPIILIQKPKEGRFIDNALKWNVGALNIDGCRIPINVKSEPDNRVRNQDKNYKLTTKEGTSMFFGKEKEYLNQLYDLKGRYPTNVIIDEMMGEIMDAVYGVKKRRGFRLNKDINRRIETYTDGVFNKNNCGFYNKPLKQGVADYGDAGGFSKYFQKITLNKDVKRGESQGVWRGERGFKINPNAISNYGDEKKLSKHFKNVENWCDPTSTVYGKSGFKRSFEHFGVKDGGGLAKFFYCPKAHVNERNLGLEDMKPQRRDKSRTKPIDNPYNRNKPVKNFHSTIKPIRLMTYLVRLLKPPIEKPLFLDPFVGSGSTLIACKIELCDCVGIEIEKNFAEIAKKRLAVPLKKFQKYTDSTIYPDDENQEKITDFEGWL